MKITFYENRLSRICYFCFIVLVLLVFSAPDVFAQRTQNRLINPILPMRDGAVERFMGTFYAIGEATTGNIYSSKNLTTWSGPVMAVTTNEATWLNDPKWTEGSRYKEIQAGDLVYRN